MSDGSGKQRNLHCCIVGWVLRRAEGLDGGRCDAHLVSRCGEMRGDLIVDLVNVESFVGFTGVGGRHFVDVQSGHQREIEDRWVDDVEKAVRRLVIESALKPYTLS